MTPWMLFSGRVGGLGGKWTGFLCLQYFCFSGFKLNLFFAVLVLVPMPWAFLSPLWKRGPTSNLFGFFFPLRCFVFFLVFGRLGLRFSVGGGGVSLLLTKKLFFLGCGFWVLGLGGVDEISPGKESALGCVPFWWLFWGR